MRTGRCDEPGTSARTPIRLLLVVFEHCNTRNYLRDDAVEALIDSSHTRRLVFMCPFDANPVLITVHADPTSLALEIFFNSVVSKVVKARS